MPSAKENIQRRLPVGAEVQPEGGTHFRVWAPVAERLQVTLFREREEQYKLVSEANGYFSAYIADANPGDRYAYVVDEEEDTVPDPASRFQPEGPHGPSQIVDSTQFNWTDSAWPGVSLPGQVLYEMHIGTFTAEGTWQSAIAELPFLAELGITVLEVMPVADFAGYFGWGYDGVNMFAPTRLYGTPDEFRSFVDQAHQLGMGVILDVVYNHFGPDGNYLSRFSPNYASRKYKNEWGEPINFDGEDSAPVREFFIANASYWIEEFHLDGLRLDAVQQIFDDSKENIIKEITRTARKAAGNRNIIITAENEEQKAQLVRPTEQGGFGLDAMWNDDFHHCAVVALTGHNDAYYTDYHGTPQEFISAALRGFLYQGQRYKWQKKRRGSPSLDISPERFIAYLENHDQVANSALGLRLRQLSNPGRYRALTALTLLGPWTPMLFQGQEYGALTPFLFFADHHTELSRAVEAGRKEFLCQFRSAAVPEIQSQIAKPHARDTFERCKLQRSEKDSEASKPHLRLHRDLLRLRAQDRVFLEGSLAAAVLSDSAFVFRFLDRAGKDRLLLVNLGRDLRLDPAPEPLLAPPEGCLWQTLWSSEAVTYGGQGTPELDTDENWQIPGEAAVVLQPV